MNMKKLVKEQLNETYSSPEKNIDALVEEVLEYITNITEVIEFEEDYDRFIEKLKKQL